MIDVHFAPTPNGHKVTIFLEETETPYRLAPVDIRTGGQFTREFLTISPNNRMPAIVDQAPTDGGTPISVFESGAILLYLAEKTGRFLPREPRGRVVATEWLFWQMAGLGPMAGQNGHFRNAAPEKLTYAIDRYQRELGRLFAVLDHRLAGRDYIADEYSIADMACYPWVATYEYQGMNMAEFPGLERWRQRVAARPAVERAYRHAVPMPQPGEIPEETRRLLYNQSAATVREAWRRAGV